MTFTAQRTRVTRTAAVAVGGASIVGALAGCSAPAASTDTQTFDTSAVYADGDYSATGSYQSPGGTEKIDVELTLAGDKITDLTVTPAPVSPNGEVFQAKFVSGINDLVVGKDIDTIVVDKVAGSSLTSGGFLDALNQIKADAVS
jgi:uncharacterized protein with FMN-binding domain